ncbi:MAG TPA: hypothetical protein VJ436_06600 [Anaerolineales bacterium]|nr:hypothetical protein [Anaerolineales bacterium]
MLRRFFLLPVTGLLIALTFINSLSAGVTVQPLPTSQLFLPLIMNLLRIATPTPTLTPTATVTSFPTLTPYRTWTPWPTYTATRPFRTFTPRPTFTNTPLPTLTPTLTSTPTSTSTSTLIPLPPITLVVQMGTPTSPLSIGQTPSETALASSGPAFGDGQSRGQTIRRLALLAAVALLWILLSGWLLLLIRRWRV